MNKTVIYTALILAFVLVAVFTFMISKDKVDNKNLLVVDGVVIKISNMAYETPEITVTKGTKVTWVNEDYMEHNVMHDHQGDDLEHDAPPKERLDPNVLEGPLLSRGESYSFIFNEVGEFDYHCSPHPVMRGKVTVIE